MPRPSRKQPALSSAGNPTSGERLQKVLASAGFGSRRQCEELIVTGRVTIDGEIITELGTRVDASSQLVSVDGEQLKMAQREYFVVNKPTGVVSTNADPSGRPRVVDLVDSPHRLFPVGRLDMSSEGLILVTNDGELANRLTHPKFRIEKIYHVEVAGQPSVEVLQKLRKGVHLAEAFAKPDSVRVKKRGRSVTTLEMVLSEGRNREIRRILARLGHKVIRLKRIALGPLRLGELPSGAHRPVTQRELAALTRAVGLRGSASGKQAKTRGRAEKPVDEGGKQQSGTRTRRKSGSVVQRELKKRGAEGTPRGLRGEARTIQTKRKTRAVGKKKAAGKKSKPSGRKRR